MPDEVAPDPLKALGTDAYFEVRWPTEEGSTSRRFKVCEWSEAKQFHKDQKGKGIRALLVSVGVVLLRD